MILMNGREIAEKRFLGLEGKMKEKGVSLSLAVVRVGENAVSDIYVRVKKRELKKRGISVSVYSFQEDVLEDDLREKIRGLEEDGVIVQLPIPVSLDKEKVLSAIPEEKDVDFLSTGACGKFYKGVSRTNPPVVGAVKTLLQENSFSVKGKTVTLVGAGDLVGKPLSVFFVREGATVSVANKDTEDLSFFTLKADVVVSGTGVPGLVTGEMIKDGAVVIDCGTIDYSGKIKGDVDRESVKMKGGLLAPVPGGVGPLTVYHLANNLLQLKIDKDEY